VWSIVEYWRAYEGDIQQIQRALGHLTIDQIETALAYYEGHKAEIDRTIASQRAAFADLLSE
jgi:uncharacterized protein (DUF433 family)